MVALLISLRFCYLFSFIWWKFHLISLRNYDLFKFIMWEFYLNSLGVALRISLCGDFIYFHDVVVLLRLIRVFAGTVIIFY